MISNFQDKGNYFRGLLILIGKDNIIHDKERKTILEIGEELGFEHKFCNDAVDDFLQNEYINLLPPKFTKQTIAMKFIEDGINLSLVDNDFDTEELEWLSKVAVENKLSSEWFDKILRDHLIDFNYQNLLS